MTPTAESIPSPDAAAAFLSMGYALRHISDLNVAFVEFFRVLQPRGQLCLLEITQPERAVPRALLKAYLRGFIPIAATLVSRHRDMAQLMRYYWDTIAACVPPATIMKSLQAAGTTRRRILVADGNLDARETLRMLLELSGHEVQTARSGRDALSVCAVSQPELVLLDIGTPEMNGYEVAEQVRREPWGQKIVLVALTGRGDEKNIHQAREAGFNRHLTNPSIWTNLIN